jgi:hypothetical protein
VLPWLDFAFILALAFVVYGGYQLTYSKDVFRAIIPKLPYQGIQLGTVGKVLRDATSRPQWDVIWMPIKKGDPIFEGDRFMTGEDSGAELELRDDIKLTLGPDSIIQIRTRGGQFFFDLIGGQVKIRNPKHLKVSVRSNGEVEEIQRTETVRSTNSQQNFMPEELGGPLVQNFVPDDEPSSPSEEQAPQMHIEAEPKSSYPHNDALIFVQSQNARIQIFLHWKCPNRCELRVLTNGTREKTVSFQTGDPISYEHHWQSGSSEKIEWFYNAKDTALKGHFSVEPFTLENFKKAAESKTKVEVR